MEVNAFTPACGEMEDIARSPCAHEMSLTADSDPKVGRYLGKYNSDCGSDLILGSNDFKNIRTPYECVGNESMDKS